MMLGSPFTNRLTPARLILHHGGIDHTTFRNSSRLLCAYSETDLQHCPDCGLDTFKDFRSVDEISLSNSSIQRSLTQLFSTLLVSEEGARNIATHYDRVELACAREIEMRVLPA